MDSSPEIAVLRILNIEFKHQMGGSDPSIPYIISPRYTLLLNDVPTLRWNKVPDANSYVVRIMKGSEIHWQEEVSGTEVVYPAVPPLEPEVDYLLTVETDNGKSSLDGGEAQLGFKLLNEEATQAVRQAAVKIASDLADETKAIILAQRYIYFNLRVDAIKILEALVEQGSQTAAVYQLLSQVYAASGLNLLAEKLYLQAIALASDTQAMDVLTEAQAGLAGVKIMLGKENEEEQLSNQAQAGYKELGDSESASRLNQRLVALKTRAVALKTRAVESSVVTPPDGRPTCCFEDPDCDPRCGEGSGIIAPLENCG